MNQIILITSQYGPRIISVIVLLSLTWLVAKFSQSMVFRAVCQCKNKQNAKASSKIMTNTAFWVVIILSSPFILRATGLEAAWLWRMQTLEGQFFSNWPIWMLLSVLLIVISNLVQSVPIFYGKLKRSKNSSLNELQN